MSKPIFILLSLLVCIKLYAAETPKLTVVVVVAKMSNDYLQLFQNNFSGQGFNLLCNKGALCKNATYSTAFTQSSPSLATIATGTTPSQHGIVADSWYSREQKRMVNACEDNQVQTFRTRDYVNSLSPKFLIGSTVADELSYIYKKSKVVSISLRPEPPILLAGRNTQHVYWLDKRSGDFISNKYYASQLPAWVESFNQKRLIEIYIEKAWNPFLQTSKYSYLTPDRTFETLGTQGKRNLSYETILQRPYGNNLVKDFALTAVVNEKLGQTAGSSDILYLYFDAQENIARQYGLYSPEWEDAYYRLDDDIAHLLSSIDNLVGKENCLFILTSDGATEKRLEQNKTTPNYFNQHFANVLLKSYIKAKYGTTDWIAEICNRQFYLNINNIKKSNKDVGALTLEIAEFLKEFKGISDVVIADELKRKAICSTYVKPFYDSYYPERSGDILMMLQPYWSDVDAKTTHLGTPYLYHTHVPLIFYGHNILPQQINDPVDMQSLAPTLSNLLNIPPPMFSKYVKIIPLRTKGM